MRASNFCSECGEQLERKGWRARFRGSLCEHCTQRLGRSNVLRPLIAIATVALAAFAIGRYMRPSPPPLIIQRAANSPLSDLPVNLNDNPSAAKQANTPNVNAGVTAATANDAVYFCGARTKKGTPCQRRVHVAGERCFQHKGMPAMLPLEKLTIKP